jgi:hypothetical protein
MAQIITDFNPLNLWQKVLSFNNEVPDFHVENI